MDEVGFFEAVEELEVVVVGLAEAALCSLLRSTPTPIERPMIIITATAKSIPR